MAKKKKKKNPIIRFLASVVAFFKDDRFRYAMGIVFLLVALFLVLSLISYLINWKTDQDFEWGKVFSGPEIQVENSGGKLGAWLSNLLINKWFGIASFLFPVILIIWAMSLYRIRLVQAGKAIKNSLILIILLSLTLGLVFGDAGGALGSGPGGQHGYFLSRWLVASIGTPGTIFLLVICYTAMLLFSTSFLNWIRTCENPFLSAGEQTEDAEPLEEQEEGMEPDKTIRMEREIEEETFVVKEVDSENNPPVKEEAPSEKEDVEMTIEDIDPEDINPDEGALGEFDPTLDLPKFRYPPLNLKKDYNQSD